ncbi:hypothetical protein [Actinoplanes digitatis]|uniref:Gram-positive cocci surface proteins LPxTG domain-containing protein n=1 Tax=Actinoplanes digitatis TaxID=1868 RepID=A0A7W7I673_9ACTN|nr:hypothetical protein [Actinoplanes digitatis]MBB4766923.1 hypothetical protein [Actinoplanes digitatis]
MGALLVPLPAAAAPAPCEQAERYAAQSGAELLRVGKLDLGPAGRTGKPITGVGVGEAKSAMVAQSTVNAAALSRMLNGGPADRKNLTEILQQTAPPSHQEPNRRAVNATDVGPLGLGRGELTAHAKWSAGMACGAATGQATRSQARLSRAGLLEDGDSALVRVPGSISSRSTTAVERRGSAARTVASASITGGSAEVLGGAVRIKVLKAPSLLAAMSTTGGGEVRYLPAVLEVSGEGFETARLDTAGDDVEVVLDEGDDTDQGGGNVVSQRSGVASGAERGDAAGPAGRNPKGKKKKPGLLSGLPDIGKLTSGVPVPGVPGVPSLPGLPVISEPPTETAPAGAPGTRVRVSLGDVRQATSGHAIAAKATAIRVVITQGSDRAAYGQGKGGVVLDFEMGRLEAAAVSPEPGGPGHGNGPNGPNGPDGPGGQGGPGNPHGTVDGIGGGLPITGPRVDVIALTGLALLIAGTGALLFGMRGRSRR